jgi:hypothetical protein
VNSRYLSINVPAGKGVTDEADQPAEGCLPIVYHFRTVAAVKTQASSISTASEMLAQCLRSPPGVDSPQQGRDL